MMRIRIHLLTLLFVSIATYCRAESVEIQDNPVPSGTISVTDGDTDRTDWDGIPWYETDEDFDEFFPVDIERVQMAHDAVNLYVHLNALEWEVEALSWRIGMYVNTDEDPTTGYNGNFLAVGADVLVEGASVFEFTGAAQTDWIWDEVRVNDLPRDQTVMTDVEVAIPLSTLGNPSVIDFLLFANNFCCDYALPDDVYPNGGATVQGDYFTYEFSPVSLTGDFNANGTLDSGDVDDLSTQSAGGTNPSSYDLNADTLVDGADLQVWVKDLYDSWMGDANLDGEFNSSDLVVVLASGTYEANTASVWTTGDFDGDGRTTSSDLVVALADGGYELGPRAAVNAVPEPSGLVLCIGALICAAVSKRGRGHKTQL